MKPTLILRLALALCAVYPLGASAESLPPGCGQLGNAYGPFDYRTHKKELEIVEGEHFTPEVERLERGNRSGVNPGGDIDYTLRASPNHHRALKAMMDLSRKEKRDPPVGGAIRCPAGSSALRFIGPTMQWSKCCTGFFCFAAVARTRRLPSLSRRLQSTRATLTSSTTLGLPTSTWASTKRR